MDREIHPNEQTQIHSRRPFFYGRLTKAKLMELPEWGILQSNATHEHTPLPELEVILGPVETRGELWTQIKKSHLAGRTFSLFVDGASYDAHMAQRDEAILQHFMKRPCPPRN